VAAPDPRHAGPLGLRLRGRSRQGGTTRACNKASDEPSQAFERGRTGCDGPQHRVAFASVAAVLLGVTVVLALRDPGPASGMRRVRSDRKARRFEQRLRPRPSRRSRAVRGTPFPSSAPSRSPNSAPPVTKLEREPKKAPRSRPVSRAQRRPRPARSSTATCPTATASPTRGRSELRLGGCCASWRRHRRECRRRSLGPAPG
jgi:hypothetical protein